MSSAQLDELMRDSRSGARALARSIEARRRRARAERRRGAQLFALEREYRREGGDAVAGVDEVGMGPLAGPVVAAVVLLPARVDLPGLDDSKRLSVAARVRLDQAIRAQALGVSLGLATRAEIDVLNIYQAGLLAMRRAVAALTPPARLVLVDGRTIPDLACRQRPIVRGDARVGSIAAASIVAKVHRDRLMRELDRRYPGYGFARNNGYGTAEHLRALAQLGPTPEHRRSFAPVRAAPAD